MTCRILGHIGPNNILIPHKEHNHACEKSKILKKKFENRVTESAESRLPALKSITKNTSVLKDEIVEDLYSYKYMASRINLIKNQKYGFNNKMLDDYPSF
ncbi:hypothetical protein DMUE_1728 [Dictyocoela muelleri]|nr:hypothetical protein DMUE_1728 [Dictyocoela muelleri]